MNETYSQVFQLPLSEKLQLLEALWDSIAAASEPVPVPEWPIEELDRRKEEYLRDPATGLSWEAVKAGIRARHG